MSYSASTDCTTGKMEPDTNHGRHNQHAQDHGRYRHRYRAKPSLVVRRRGLRPSMSVPALIGRLGLRLSRGIPALSRGHFEVELGDGSIALFIDRQIDVVITRCGVSRNLHRGIECAAVSVTTAPNSTGSECNHSQYVVFGSAPLPVMVNSSPCAAVETPSPEVSPVESPAPSILGINGAPFASVNETEPAGASKPSRTPRRRTFPCVRQAARSHA